MKVLNSVINYNIIVLNIVFLTNPFSNYTTIKPHKLSIYCVIKINCFYILTFDLITKAFVSLLKIDTIFVMLLYQYTHKYVGTH